MGKSAQEIAFMVFGAAVSGAVSGAVFAATGNAWLAGAAGAAVGDAVGQFLKGGTIDWRRVAVAAGVGAAFSGILAFMGTVAMRSFFTKAVSDGGEELLDTALAIVGGIYADGVMGIVYD